MRLNITSGDYFNNYIKTKENLAPCDIVSVEIIDASEYDLWGRVSEARI